MKQQKGCRMSCDVGKAAEGLKNELWRRWSGVRFGESASFSNHYIASPTPQLLLQPFRCFTYIIGTSPTSPGESPIPLSWCLIYPLWFVIYNDCGPQGYMKDVNWPSNWKCWRPLTYTQSIHAIIGLEAVERMGNLLCGRPSILSSKGYGDIWAFTRVFSCHLFVVFITN